MSIVAFWEAQAAFDVAVSRAIAAVDDDSAEHYNVLRDLRDAHQALERAKVQPDIDHADKLIIRNLVERYGANLVKWRAAMFEDRIKHREQAKARDLAKAAQS